MSAPHVVRTERLDRVPAPSAPTSASLALIVAWAIVGIPAVWGVTQTVIKSLALFR